MFEASICDPMLCLILQGCKQLEFGDEDFTLRAGECAVVSHDLPIWSRVRDAPYLVVLFSLELEVLRGLYAELGELRTPAATPHAVTAHAADANLLDVVSRALALTGSERDARVLGAAVTRELHYRLAVSPLGLMLRSLSRSDSQESAVARAVAMLRRDFRSPMVIESLARAVGMSTSSFHKHFKAVMASSPLQYQKSLRLLEARRRLTSGAASVTSVAFEVGYESPSQFSREYLRRFGRPPSRDALRG